MVQLTQHCLYLDSAGYMKHSYMKQNLCTEQDKETPCTVLTGGICKFVGSIIQQTFEHSFRLLFSKHHSSSSNTLDMLELHTTFLMPDLARYSCVHVCELRKKKDFISLGPKKLSSLFVLAFFD